MELQRVGLDLVSERQQQLTFNNSKKGETNSNKIYYLDKYIQSIINMKTNKKNDIFNLFSNTRTFISETCFILETHSKSGRLISGI